jgi:hypothetical protein
MISTVGAYFATAGKQSFLGTEAGLNDINARLSEDSAKGALLQGQREVQKSEMATTNLEHTQTADYAARGVDVNAGGTVGNVKSTTQIMGAIDANTINANAVRSAWGYRTQASNFADQAILQRGQSASLSPMESAEGQFLTSASQVAMNGYMMSKSGAWDPPPSPNNPLRVPITSLTGLD